MSVIQLYDKYLIIISSKPIFQSNAFLRYRGTDYVQYVAQYPATSV